GCGAASNTRRFICEPTTPSAKPAPRSGATSTSTIAVGRTRALTARHPIKPTSTRCPSAWQPNPGRGSTYRRGKSVQTTGATSVALRTEQRSLQVPTKLKYVVRHITLIVARDHSLLDLLREVQAECLGADYVPLKKGGASQT